MSLTESSIDDEKDNTLDEAFGEESMTAGGRLLSLLEQISNREVRVLERELAVLEQEKQLDAMKQKLAAREDLSDDPQADDNSRPKGQVEEIVGGNGDKVAIEETKLAFFDSVSEQDSVDTPEQADYICTWQRKDFIMPSNVKALLDVSTILGHASVKNGRFVQCFAGFHMDTTVSAGPNNPPRLRYSIPSVGVSAVVLRIGKLVVAKGGVDLGLSNENGKWMASKKFVSVDKAAAIHKNLVIATKQDNNEWFNFEIVPLRELNYGVVVTVVTKADFYDLQILVLKEESC